MQVLEFRRKDGWFRTVYAASFIVGLSPETVLESEFRQITAALHEWRARRGAQGRTVQFVLSGDPALHTKAEAMLECLYRQDPDSASLLQSVEVKVSLLDNDGTPVKQYRVQPGMN